jgi:hypothetical protein
MRRAVLFLILASGCASTNLQTKEDQERAAAAEAALTPWQRFVRDVPDPEERRLIGECWRSDQEIAEAHRSDQSFECSPSAEPSCFERRDVHRAFALSLEDRRERRIQQLQTYRQERTERQAEEENQERENSPLVRALRGFNARRNSERRIHCEKSFGNEFDCTEK